MEDRDAARTLEQKLAQLQSAYRTRLAGMMEAAAGHWSAANNGDSGALESLFALIHRISGSAGSFGYHRLSAAALPLEQTLKQLVQEERFPDGAELAALDERLKALHQLWQEEVGDPRPQPQPLAPVLLGPDAPLYLLARDPDLTRSLLEQLTQFDYRTRVFASVAELRQAINRTRPSILLLEQSLTLEDEGFVTRLQRLADEIPLVMIGDSEDIQARLAAVHCGAVAYLIKPVEIDDLVGWLDQLVQRRRDRPYRVLIVDDDRELAESYALALEAAGMEPEVLSEPLNIMKVLADRHPDLILMDVYMPTASGIDLARAVRQQRTWLSTPIIFLSVEADADRRLAAKSLAGDDFLTKPIPPERLVREVAGRAERARVLRSMMETDSLTGLFNHVCTKERLAVEIDRARRQGLALSFVLLDLDHFKEVNDRYGHLAGDRVLRVLANLLRHRLRKSDVVGRYGGEEFAAILNHTPVETAARVMEELREAFSRIEHLAEGETFRVTLSCGVSGFTGREEAADMILAADAALYRAKGAGRNRVLVG